MGWRYNIFSNFKEPFFLRRKRILFVSSVLALFSLFFSPGLFAVDETHSCQNKSGIRDFVKVMANTEKNNEATALILASDNGGIKTVAKLLK